MAREKKPAIIFIDEVDSLCGSRSEGENETSRRVKTEFLVQMNGVGNDMDGVLVLGATNVPWELDSAIRRRFEKRIYIGLPDFEAKRFLVEKKLGEVPHSLSPQQFDQLAEKIENYSGSDIEILVKDAAMEPLRFAQTTTKFKKLFKDGMEKFMPVDPSTPVGSDIIDCELYALPDRSLELPKVSLDDFLKSMKRSKASVSPEDLQDFVDWTKQFGEEG